MKPALVKLPIIWRGCEYFPIILHWKNRDGTPFDLTGWSPRASARKFSLNATVISPASNGATQISLTKAQTDNLKLGTEYWDWVWFNNGTFYPPVLAGNVLIKEPTTGTNAF